LQRALPALGAALPLIVLFITVLSIFLTVTENLGLSEGQTASWIMVAYGLPGLLSLGLALHYRQPLVLTGNLFALIFVSSLAGQISYPELIGAFIVTGAGMVLVTALGLTGLLASWIPAPVVLGLLAGAIMPFISDVFTSFGEAPLLVGGTVLAYVLSRRVLGERLPAILPALVAGLALAALTPRTIQRRLKKYGEKAGVDVSPHKLRHTMATRLLNQGMPIHSLQKLLGHEHLNATQIYARLYDQTLYRQFREATARLEGLAADNWPQPLVSDPVRAEMEVAEALSP
jgi:hypothetical protein